MVTQSGVRDEVLGRLANIIGARSKQGTVRVAIDGIDAAGKTTLADELAQVLRSTAVPTLRASIDGFHHPASVRHSRSDDHPARSYYEDSFNYRALRRLLLDPLGESGDNSVRTRIFNFRTDEAIDEAPTQVRVGTALLFDGVFLLRPELKDCWDLSVFLEVDPAISLARALNRDLSLFGSRETTEHRYLERYLPGQELYVSLVHPERRAEILIDNNNPAAPRLLRIPPA
ncbi:MAG: uridine kinase [Acidimicrobiia bacterium]|nr:uridine kinase [Acidimicrobiia bacterium]